MSASDYGYASSGSHTTSMYSYNNATHTLGNWLYGNGYEWTDQKGSYIKMEDPYGNYVDGKSGNGYARITYLGN